MSQKLYDSVWGRGSQAFAVLFGKDPVFYRMMSPFYVETNQEINSLGFPGIPASVDSYGRVLQFTIQKHRLIDSLVNAYFQQPEVKAALSIFETNAFGGPAYYGDVSKLSPTAKVFVSDWYPDEASIRLAMRYGFLHYAINPVSSVYKKFLIDEPEMSFAPGNPIEHFQQAFSVVASGYLTAIGPEGIQQTFSGFGKPLDEQNWNPVTAQFQLANSFEGLVIGAVITGAVAADVTLAGASAEAAAAAPAATAGTTVAEVSVAVGAESAGAATAGGGVLSSITSWGSAQGAAALTAAGAAIESEAKKRAQAAIVDALTPDADAAPGGSPAAGSSAVPKVVEQKNSMPYLWGAGLLALLYSLT